VEVDVPLLAGLGRTGRVAFDCAGCVRFEFKDPCLRGVARTNSILLHASNRLMRGAIPWDDRRRPPNRLSARSRA